LATASSGGGTSKVESQSRKSPKWQYHVLWLHSDARFEQVHFIPHHHQRPLLRKVPCHLRSWGRKAQQSKHKGQISATFVPSFYPAATYF
jgi:hypothetical protein